MNDFIEKPIDTKVRETALRIMERAMFYNSTKTGQELTSGKPTFFVRFAGHTAALYVDIYANGWDQGGKSEGFDIYLSESEYNGTADEIQSELASVLRRMEEAYDVWYEKENTNE